MLKLIHPPPLSLYIHYPWCVKKCPYCDFNSHQLKHEKNLNQQYVNALIDDIEQELPSIWGRNIHSIFIGGGTPSLLEPKELDHLICQLKSRLSISPMVEITLEANPGTIDYIKFSEFKAIGINRLSIGIQSFNNQQLKFLGRIHSAQDAIHAVENAHKSGFKEINLDLMFALPQQGLKQAEEDIEQAISLFPQHISYYQLTIENNTFFASHPPPLPNDDLAFSIYQQGQDNLIHHGFEQYEISAWSKPNHQCQHNLNYWSFGDYLGIGAGAHGKLTMVNQQQILRNWKFKQPSQYLACTTNDNKSDTGKYVGGSQSLTEDELVFEFMLNTTRLKKGVKLDLFKQTTGLPLSTLSKKLDLALQKELITINNDILCPTNLGFTYLNDLQELFL